MRPSVLCIAIAASASALSAQNLLLPDNHHLTESVTQNGTAGSTNWWGITTTGRRFQVLYEASHFTGKAGVSGPIVLTHLRFRGEENEKNTGGQTYTGVTVTVCKTTLTSGTMSTTTFASNLPPGVGGTTTTIGSVVIPTLTVAPSLGGAPNSNMIDLDLTTGLPVLFDPLTDALGQVNLLVDVVWTGYAPGPAIPPATATIAMIPTADTTAHGAGIRGRGIYATTPAALTGTASTSPPVIAVEFAGGGGYAALNPARTEYIGASCSGSVPSTSGFYQGFTTTNPFDLGGVGLTLVPDSVAAPTKYTVSFGAGAFDPTRVNAAPSSIADDGIVTFALGYTFNYPGGSTATIKPVTNGFVWLDSAMTATDFSPSLLEWLSPSGTYYSARLATLWHDFDAGENTVSHPNSGLHVLNDTSGGAGNTVTYVTWFNIGEFTTATGGGQSVNNMQMVLYQATGVVEFRYGSMQNVTGSSSASHCGFTGFTRGRIGGSAGVGSLDPGSRDLSHEAFIPFSTGPEVAANPHITATSLPLAAGPDYGARMFGGQSLTFNVNNVPAGTILMWINLDIAASMPGIQFPGITAPGCMISTGPSPLILAWESAVFPGANFVGTLPLAIPHIVWDGATITAQAMEIDISGGPNLVKWASDTMKFTVGLD